MQVVCARTCAAAGANKTETEGCRKKKRGKEEANAGRVRFKEAGARGRD